MSQKPKEKHFERINTKGQHVEVIEETLPGKKEEYGKMVKRTENHNLYESGTHNLPGEKRYREILLEQEKKKKEEQKKKGAKSNKIKECRKNNNINKKMYMWFGPSRISLYLRYGPCPRARLYMWHRS